MYWCGLNPTCQSSRLDVLIDCLWDLTDFEYDQVMMNPETDLKAYIRRRSG